MANDEANDPWVSYAWKVGDVSYRSPYRSKVPGDYADDVG